MSSGLLDMVLAIHGLRRSTRARKTKIVSLQGSGDGIHFPMVSNNVEVSWPALFFDLCLRRMQDLLLSQVGIQAGGSVCKQRQSDDQVLNAGLTMGNVFPVRTDHRTLFQNLS